MVMVGSPHAVAPGGVVHVLPFTDVTVMCASTDRDLPPQWTHDANVKAIAMGSSSLFETASSAAISRCTYQGCKRLLCAEARDPMMSTSQLMFTTDRDTEGTFTCSSHPDSQWIGSRIVRILTRGKKRRKRKYRAGLRPIVSHLLAKYCAPIMHSRHILEDPIEKKKR